MQTNPRQQRGFEIAATMPVAKFGKAYLVSSQAGEKPYKVTWKAGKPACTCPDHEYRHVECKHIHAAAFAALGVNNRHMTKH